MNETKHTCTNCVEWNDWNHPFENRVICDLTGEIITNGSATCEHWEPNDEELLSQLQKEVPALRAKLDRANKDKEIFCDQMNVYKKGCETLEAKLEAAEKELYDEREEHSKLEARCYEGFPSATDGIFSAYDEARRQVEKMENDYYALQTQQDATIASLRSALRKYDRLVELSEDIGYCSNLPMTEEKEEQEKIMQRIKHALSAAPETRHEQVMDIVEEILKIYNTPASEFKDYSDFLLQVTAPIKFLNALKREGE